MAAGCQLPVNSGIPAACRKMLWKEFVDSKAVAHH
jgi:hypothetical protein